MSRIGKQPIAIPAKVKVDVKGSKVFVEGPKGKLDLTVHPVLREADPAHGYLLITFDERNGDFPEEVRPHLERASEPQSRQVEEELTKLRQQLRTTVEQYETQV